MISIVIISKDEEALDGTLTDVQEQTGDCGKPSEIIVVDASEGRLDHIRQRHAAQVRWLQFERPAQVAVSIPHQRNMGVRAARGEIIVFTDAGCSPDPGWLVRLVAPLSEGEDITAGSTLTAEGDRGLYGCPASSSSEPAYLPECPTINLAFSRAAYDRIGGFDERFAYGSDVDFTWRLVDAGYRIRSVPDATVRHDWGTWRRQVRRSYAYGRARARLYRKHAARRRQLLRREPMVVAYPLFLLGLPLTIIFPFYPLLLLIPAWRNRSLGAFRVVADHVIYGLGVLAELILS